MMLDKLLAMKKKKKKWFEEIKSIFDEKSKGEREE